MRWQELHQFWFGEIQITDAYYAQRVPLWFFGRTPEFDRECAERFGPWLNRPQAPAVTPTERLAQIILLDQVPRNTFRQDPRAYQDDHRAQRLSLEGVAQGLDAQLSWPEKIFLYMPLEHAEDLGLQTLSVEKFTRLHADAPAEIRAWTALALEKALAHQDTIRQHGHFPSRRLRA